ncbi:hypothetical protein Pcinc_015325 [Petrolisthes cinctipes]|uniref:L-Fucosyltransferase n=1 Tax=Petrolisthes cinctipes TaxID=88211 RepID=A0AAE1FT85_PETCI|nr:hypothetical protein Pcinc_015325 [Petrolisthes cinctipes]
MGEYATMYSLKRHYNVTVVITKKFKKKIKHIFLNTSLPDIPASAGYSKFTDWTPVKSIGSRVNYAPIELAAAGLLGAKNFIMTENSFEIQMFNQFKEEVRKEFTFAPTYTTKSYASPQTLTQPLLTPTLTQPLLTPTLTQPLLTQTLTQPLLTQTLTQPLLTQPLLTPTLTQPLLTQTLTQPLLTQTLTQPLLTPTLTQPLLTQTLTQPLLTQTLTQPLLTPTITHPNTDPTITHPNTDPTITHPNTDPTITHPNTDPTITHPNTDPTITHPNTDPTITHPNTDPTITHPNTDPTITHPNTDPTITHPNTDPTITHPNTDPTITHPNTDPTITHPNTDPTITHPNTDPTKELMVKANGFLSKIMENRSSELPDPVFVGFHIRRTDYKGFIKIRYGGGLPETAYYTRALSHYRTKFPDAAVFIVASDDLKYARSELDQYHDVFFSPGFSPGEDMALLASCNHSIITVGSYGFWSAYLAGGEVVYADVTTKIEYRFSRKIYEKIGLDNFIPLPID